MRITVSRHAIERCKDRVPWLKSTSDRKIEKTLSRVVTKGKKTRKRPAKAGKAFEYVYNDIHVVGVHSKGNISVVTCYGDSTYRKWLHKQSSKRFCCAS